MTRRFVDVARGALFGAAIGLSALVAPAAAETITVATVNYPLAYFAERIGGDVVSVYFPAPADRDPGLWRPRIAEIAEYQNADVILLNGGGFAAWTERTSLPRRRLVDVSRAFQDRFIETETITHSHGADGEHSHEAVATYFWLDFALASEQAAAVAARLTRESAENGALFEANLAALQTDLAALDVEARAIGARLSGTRVIASHPRYEYFARAYGITIDAVAWEPGATPTEAGWSELDALLAADAEGAPAAETVFIFEAPPTAEADAGVRERGFATVVFRTSAARPADGDFLSVMRLGLAALAAAAP